VARDVDYDLIAIGSGPAGQKAAIQAAKLGARAAVVDRGRMLGGVCLHTGTIPSKTLREAVLHLTGVSQRSLLGHAYRAKEELEMEDLHRRARQVIERETDVIRSQLARNHVTLYRGTARFGDARTVVVSGESGEERVLRAARIVVATGTTPARPRGIEIDNTTVLDSDGILGMKQLPRTLVVVGAGVIGIEYASMFAALGTRVTVVEQRPRLLEFCDGQIVEALQYHLRELGVTFRLGEAVASVVTHNQGALTELASGKRILADAVLCSAGREGATAGLELEAAGLTADERGRIAVDGRFRTAVKNVWAVGDVIGFPSLAATSMEQGRLAACDAFGVRSAGADPVVPFGIYTVPEISFAGATEEELTAAAVPYEIGASRYRELARGQIVGDAHGLLKLLVCPDTRRLLGVHVFGTGAAEVVHVGQAVMALGGTVDYLVDAVFNYPTLAEAYKVAALDATNKLRDLSRLSA
jgi:NAD(P) transhydrogenase